MIVPLDQPPPAVFAAAVGELSAVLTAPERAGVRRGLALRAVPAPRAMAPWAFAVAAEVRGPDLAPGSAGSSASSRGGVRTGPGGQGGATRGSGGDAGDDPVGSGRFVLLHDPAGQPGWQGDTRVVTFVEADVEPEMAADPALAEVAWSWLLESLEQRAARFAAAGGTVTRTLSTRLGELADDEDASSVEVRASWTALPRDGGLALPEHLLAWCDLLAATAGLPPPGVTALPHR